MGSPMSTSSRRLSILRYKTALAPLTMHMSTKTSSGFMSMPMP
jgi:hypothetical protein